MLADQALLTVKDISQRLNMSVTFVYQELSSGRLEHYQLGKVKGRIRVSENQLGNYLEYFRKARKEAVKREPVIVPPSHNQISSELNKLFRKGKGVVA